MSLKKVTISDLMAKKKLGNKITMSTAYDYLTAQMVEEAGIDTILVGDSVAPLILGYPSTMPVTMEEMIHHIKAVTRAVNRVFVIGDMPFMSYQAGAEKAIENAGRFIKEGGCDAVKLEGGSEFAHVVEAINNAGIPVCPHIGFTPQSATMLSDFDFSPQGQDIESAKNLIKAAKDFEKAGAFMIVMVSIPDILASKITEDLDIPTIGIGAGRGCDGQLIAYPLFLGLIDGPVDPYVKQYINLRSMMIDSFKKFKKEVEEGIFPGEEHSFKLNDEVAEMI